MRSEWTMRKKGERGCHSPTWGDVFKVAYVITLYN